MAAPYITDPGAILRSGAALIPDLQAQLAQRQQLDLQRQQVGVQMINAQRQLAEDAREKATMDAYAADIVAIGNLPPEQQPQAITALMRKYPKQSEALKRSYDAQDEAVKQADFREAGEIYSLLQNGAPDKAAAKLRARVTADKAAGLDTEDDEAILAQLESGDPAQMRQATAQIGWQLSTVAGADKFASTFGAINPSTEFEKTYEYIKGQFGQEAADNYALNRYDPFIENNTKYGTNWYRSSQIPSLGGAQQQGGAQGGGAPSVGDRGTRNNNPGNLKDGPFARRQPGYKGADSDGFAIFADPSQGAKAQERLLSGSYLSKGIDTPRKIIARYAPAGENSSASMTNYAAYVARRLGIGVDDKVPAGKAGLLAQAMREFETGQTKAAPGPVRVTSKAQRDKLAPGTVYIAPDGSRRTKS